MFITTIGRMASLGYETQDAATYAEWGVDYLKVQRTFNVSPALFFSHPHRCYAPWMQWD